MSHGMQGMMWVIVQRYMIINFCHGHLYTSFNAPPGSSSLYFPTSNKEITPDEGRVVVFPGNVEHYVPENKSDNRVVLVGNSNDAPHGTYT